MVNRKEVLVTVLTFNEGEKLLGVLKRFPDPLPYELLIVDDGSTDGTTTRVAACGLPLIRHDQNRGVGASLRDAIGYGRNLGCKYIVVMAGNGKMQPSEIPRLLEPLLSGKADYVQGSRNLEGGKSPNLPLGRKIAIGLFTGIVNLFLGRKTTDVTCGFRAYRLDLFDNSSFRIDQDWLDRYELEYYIHYKVLTLGYKFVEVPISMVYPEEKQNYSKIKPLTGWWSILRPWIFLVLRLKR